MERPVLSGDGVDRVRGVCDGARVLVRQMTMSDEWDSARSHPKWDGKHLRVLLDVSAIEALPVKEIDFDEMYERMTTVSWNGLEWYPQEVTRLPHELGYDAEGRYVRRDDPRA